MLMLLSVVFYLLIFLYFCCLFAWWLWEFCLLRNKFALGDNKDILNSTWRGAYVSLDISGVKKKTRIAPHISLEQ